MSRLKGVLRTVAERVARGRVVRRRLRVGDHTARIYVSPDAQLKYLKPGGIFDHDLITLAETYVRQGDNVWDIGANVGVFSFAAALVSQTGCIMAVEPDPFLCGILERTRATPAFAAKDIRVVPIAVSDTSGLSSFAIARRGRASNALVSEKGRSQSGGVRETRWVPTLSLDHLLAEVGAPAVVKIDIEGAELSALRGADQLLRDVRPIIYIEVGREHVAACNEILASHDYDFRSLSGESMASLSFNTLAVPRR